jgi:hypothetical protein
MKFGDLLK